MPINLSDDTEIEATSPATEEKLSELEEMVQSVEESAEEPADEPEEEVKEDLPEEELSKEEAAPEVTPELTLPPVVEGPTIAAKMAAEQAGIPPQLVEMAVSDEQLSKFVELARQSSSSADTAETPLELPEDEYPQDDPVRKAFAALQSEVTEMKSTLRERETKALELEQQQQKAAEFTARQTQEQFDKTLNELGIDSLGNTKKLSSANFHARSATFNLVQELQEENPSLSVADLAKKAAEMLYPTNNLTTVAKEAIRKQSKSRLGAGPSQPAEAGQRSEEAMMKDFLKASGLTE